MRYTSVGVIRNREVQKLLPAEVFANKEEVNMTNPEVEVLRGELAELKTLVETISEQNYEATIGDEWMSTKEASAYTKLSVRTINRAVKNGEVQVSQKVGKNMFRRSWLDQWLGVPDIHTNRNN